MADNVENRVVEMQFDNKDFEQGVSTSLNTLDKLKEALKFENAAKGFTEIQNSIKKIDFSPIENSLQSLESGFMTLAGSLKRNFFDEISNSIIGMGQQLYQNTLGQIKSGGQRRAMNIEQAKFKISGLGEDWDTVYKDMDYAVSGTAYGIDQAANAASQFLASGVQTGDDMKAALRGISGIAAMTSADYDEIANIFTAAAGKGKVQAMELNRISQRGVNAASAIAQQLGTTEEAVRDMASKGQLDFQTFATAMDNAFGEHAKKANETFTGSMSNMKAALSRIGEIFYAPYLENMIPVFNRLRETIDKFKNAMKEPLNEDKESVATKIADLYKKLSDLFLAWSDTWEPALDQLPEKMKLWFVALDHIGNAVDKFKDILVDVGNGVKELTKDASTDLSKLTEQEEKAARDIWIWGNWGNGDERRKNLEAAGMSYERVQAVVEKIVAGTYKWDTWLFKAAGISKDSAEAYEIHSWAVKKIIEIYDIFHRVIDTTEVAMQKVWKVLRSIWQAYTETWSKLTNLEKIHSPWRELVQTIRVAIKNFVIAGKRAENIKKTFQGFFAAIKLGSHIAASAIRYFRPIIRLLMTGEPVVSKLTGEVGEFTYNTVEAIIASEKIPKTFKAISTAIQNVIKKVQEFAGTDKFSIKGIFTSIVDHVKNVFKTIKDLATGKTTFSEVFKSIWEKVQGFFTKLSETAEELGIPLDKIFETVKNFVTKILNLVGTTLFGSDFSFSDWFKKIFSKEDAEGEAKESEGIIPTLSKKLGGLSEQMAGLWENIKKFVSSITNGISTVWNFIVTQIANLNDTFTSIFTFIQKIFNLGSSNADNMASNFKAFGEFITTCFVVARDIVWSIREPLKSIVKSIADMVAGVFNMFAGISNWVGDDPEGAYGAAAFFALLKLIDKIMDYKILKQRGTKDSVLYSVATFFDDMKSAVDMWKKEHLERVLESIAAAVLKIAIAIALLVAVMSGAAIGTSSEAATEAALESFIYLMAFLWSMFAIMVISKNVFSKPMDLTFLTLALKSIATTMLIISAGLAILMASIDGLDTGQIAVVMGIMAGILILVFVGIGALVYLSTTWNIDEKKLAAVTTFMLAFAKGIKSIMKGISWLMASIIAMVKLQGDDPDAWDNACHSLIMATSAAAMLMLALGAAFAVMFITGQNMPDSKKLGMLALMLIVYTGCIKSVMNSLILLVGVMELSDSDTMFAALGFVTILSLLLAAVVAGAVALLNHVNDPAKITEGLTGVALVLFVMGKCILSIAEAAAILAVAGVTNSQMESIVLIVGIISALVLALAAIGMIGGAASGTGLLAFAGGILMIAAAIYVINLAILTIVKAITMLIATFVALAAVWPTISDRVPGMLTDLETSLPKFIKLIGECIVGVANVIIEAAPLIGEAIAIIIATAISVGWGYIPKVVGNFLAMLDETLDLLIDGAETILPKMLLLLLMFIEYLDANAVALGYLLGSVLMKVVWGALMALGDFISDTVIPWFIDFIKRNVSGAKDSLVDAISDAMVGDVRGEDTIQAEWRGEVNSVTGTHMWYRPWGSDEYYETYEEARDAELNKAVAEAEENANKNVNLKSETLNKEVKLNTKYTEEAKGLGSFKDSDSYKELTDNTELKEKAGSVWDDLVNTVSGKANVFKEVNDEAGKEAGKTAVNSYTEEFESGVGQDSYIKFLQSQSAKTGKDAGTIYGENYTDGAKTAAEKVTQFMPEMSAPAIEMPDTTDLQKQFSNMDYSTYMQDMDLGTGTIKTDVQGDGLAFNELAEGKATVSMDSDQYTQALQQNNSTNQEQLTMLEKVKATLDELKSNLKDVIILPKGSNINITNQMDAQVVGKTIEPVVSTIQGRNNVKAKQGLASGGGRYSRD